ncbi:MAG: ion transporter [Bacteroidales bacterium]|nr:ion transporter [Bacteroidales bacterium]
MRKSIYRMIELAKDGDRISWIYDTFMLIAIAASIVPLMFEEDTMTFRVIEQLTVTVFIIDYLLRWITADYRLKKKGMSFVMYPFTGWAIIDMMSILPGLSLIGRGFKILRVTRLLRILRLFKFVRYSDKIQVLGRVIRKEKGVLLTVLGISIFYVFLTALIMFNAEPHINPFTGAKTFEDFFDALYWATVTLTTVGYGDMIPVTDLGRFISMLSSLFGVAIIALPSGVITARYLEELRNAKDQEEEDDPETDICED